MIAEKGLMEIELAWATISQSWDSHETVMRLTSIVFEGVNTVAPVSDKGVPTDAEVPHLNQEYCQQLEEHLRQEDHKKE